MRSFIFMVATVALVDFLIRRAERREENAGTLSGSSIHVNLQGNRDSIMSSVDRHASRTRRGF